MTDDQGRIIGGDGRVGEYESGASVDLETTGTTRKGASDGSCGQYGRGFLEETPRGRVVSCQVRRQQLDRHMPIQAWVKGLIDDAHAAAAELADDLVGAELGAGDRVIRGGKYSVGEGRGRPL